MMRTAWKAVGLMRSKSKKTKERNDIQFVHPCRLKEGIIQNNSITDGNEYKSKSS